MSATNVRILFSRPARDDTLALIENKMFFGFSGISTDTKPTTVQDGNRTIGVCTGSYFLEADTGNLSYYNEATETWGGGD